jgi:subtilisin family serine protease
LFQLRHEPALHAAAEEQSPLAAVAPRLATRVSRHLAAARIDETYAPVQLPTPISPETGALTFSLGAAVEFADQPEQSTYIVRAEVPDEPQAQRTAWAQAFADPDVVGLWADPQIQTFPVYCGAAPVGDADDVRSALGVQALDSAGLDGNGVDVAVVDGGINRAHLQGLGLPAQVGVQGSYTPPGDPARPGQHEVGHGTMCAFDVGLSAPRARLLDCAVLATHPPGATVVAGWLSNAIAAYSGLLRRRSGRSRNRPLVVTNSWGVFNPAWDFPPGNPGNYTDNPAHPFNIIVASLERAGADILFAAGNCGRDCPDGRCAFPSRPIGGANSHPAVLSIAAVDVRDRRLGYSSQGPGRLADQKPDIAAYSHFVGSGALADDGQPADVGTSAACPGAAGVIAAVRSQHAPSKLAPSQLRALVLKTARNLGAPGYDYDYGWGLITPENLVAALA